MVREQARIGWRIALERAQRRRVVSDIAVRDVGDQYGNRVAAGDEVVVGESEQERFARPNGEEAERIEAPGTRKGRVDRRLDLCRRHVEPRNTAVLQHLEQGRRWPAL